MRLGTFNVENMFDRAAAMNLPTWAEGKPILEDFKRLNNLIGIEMYSNADTYMANQQYQGVTVKAVAPFDF